MVSAFWIATVLGANSPTTTWTNVISRNARMVEITCTDGPVIWIKENTGINRWETVFSPIHPKTKERIVIPSWTVDKYSSKLESIFLAARALLFPSSTSWSIRVLLTFTIANSDATKNAESAMIIKTSTSLNMSSK